MLSMVDAAYALLQEKRTPQHYKDLTNEAIQRGLISTQGLTPEASLLSAISRENSRRIQHGEIPRFEQVDDGVYGLVEWRPTGIEQKIQEINQSTRQELRSYLVTMPPKAFEELIGKLLISLGFDEDTVEVTGRSGDGGIDVIGIMDIEGFTRLDVAVQVKRVKANIPAEKITALRGSLLPHQRGIFVTTSEFTKQATQEASASGKAPISLIGGSQLLALFFEHQIGVSSKEHIVYELNYNDLPEIPASTAPVISAQSHKVIREVSVAYPLSIFARYKGNHIEADLLETGQVQLYGELYNSVSSAGMAVTDWKSCNGWRFWFFINPSDGKEYILDVLRMSTSI
jgi:hypothetical protein